MVSSKHALSAAPRPDTYFAPAERATPRNLSESVEEVVNSPIWQTALQVFGGWVAVLNEHRQVLAVNHALLRALGIEDPADLLGLRPGEILHCAHAQDHSGGCGTGKACETCGAAVAIVAAQQTGEPHDSKCALTSAVNDTRLDRIFDVRCSPVDGPRGSLLLLTMRDISGEERRAALERTFLHDVSTTLTALAGTSSLLTPERVAKKPELLSLVREASGALVRDVKIQRLLCQNDATALEIGVDEVRPSRVLKQVEAILSGHPAAEGQTLVVEQPADDTPFPTDAGLLSRVLVNMVVNGLESGEPGDQVRIRCEATGDCMVFSVWSRRPMPERVAARVFQRYFSTKAGDGRGTGTYSMKLLGESLLQGQVDFTTCETEGTTFRVTLPARPRRA